MPQSPFSRDALYGIRKPGSSFKTTIDRASPLAGGLSTVLLFDGPKLTDAATSSRAVSRRGTLIISRGLRGGQARSVITAPSGSLFSPCLTLNPTTAAPSGFTLSARVQFDGTNPSAGSFGSIGAALAADDTGRMPVFISPVSGSFRTRVSAENEFLSSGANLIVSSLSGWHRITVTISGSLATLYVDGGATFVGSATQAMANWNLRAVLGSDITSGVQWNWQTADVFFWTRALSADEVLAHHTRPYAPLKSALAERFVAAVLPETAVDLTNPWDLPFTDDFGPQIAPGVIAQLSGQASFSANASSVVHSNFVSASAVLGGAAFLQAAAGVKKTASAAFAGSASLAAQSLPPGVMFIGNGSSNLVSAARIVRTGVSMVSGSSGLTASPGVRYSVRAVFQGGGTISANPVALLPFNQAQATLSGSGNLSASCSIRRAGRATFAGAGGFTDSALVGTNRSRAVLNGNTQLIARASVRKAKKMRPGMPIGMIPAFAAIEIDTFVPGAITAISSASHGTRAHGTRSSQPLVQIDNAGMIRASDVGYRTAPTDTDGPISYPPLLSDAYQIDALMALEPSATAASAAWGSISLANPNGTFDPLMGVQNSDGRGVRILSGSKQWDFGRQYLTDPPYTSLAPFFTGLATPWSLTDDGLQVPIRDATYFLEKPLQQDFYGGSGGLDGTPDLAGKPKPMARGGFAGFAIQNVTPILIDPVNLIYQYTDGPGQLSFLYEGAATGQGSIQFAGDTTDLYSGSTPFGQYRTDNSRGLFQLGSVPVGQITVDVVGLFPNAGGAFNPYDICRLLLTEDMSLPASLIDLDSFTAAAAATPSYTAGVYFAPDQAWTCVQAVDAMLTSLGANIVPTRDGKLRLLVLRSIADTEPVTDTYDKSSIISISRQALPSTLDPPPYRFRIGYAHNYTVQTTGVNASLSTAERRQFVVSPDRFASFGNTALLNAYRRPNDFDAIPGPLLAQANAQEVANALGDLWSTNLRRLYAVTLPRKFFGREIGDVVHIVYPIEQLAGGRNGRVVGYSLRSTDSVVVYQVLV